MSDRPATKCEPDDKEIEITPEMIGAGANRLDDLTVAGGGLVCTPDYVAKAVYRAMEKERKKI